MCSNNELIVAIEALSVGLDSVLAIAAAPSTVFATGAVSKLLP
jgi:hypothetical protein